MQTFESVLLLTYFSELTGNIYDFFFFFYPQAAGNRVLMPDIQLEINKVIESIKECVCECVFA